MCITASRKDSNGLIRSRLALNIHLTRGVESGWGCSDYDSNSDSRLLIDSDSDSDS